MTEQPDAPDLPVEALSSSAVPPLKGRWLAMVFISLGVSMIMVDASVINVALPTIIRDIGLTATEAEWANSIYPLVFAALLITFGRTGDRFGRRRLFMLGAVVFIVASILVALSGSGTELISARVLQGVGGALMLPTSLALVNATFTGKDRAMAFGLWGATIGATAAIGPLLGGWLTTYYSWQWAFYINVPIGIVLLVGTWFVVQESKEVDPETGVDLAGIALSALGLGLLVFALIEGQAYGWWTATEDAALGPWQISAGGLSPVPVAFALSALLLGSFLLVEQRRARAGRIVLLDLSLFGIRSFGWGNIVALIVAFGEFGLVFALPLFLQSTLGLSAVATGGLVATIAVGVFFSGPTAGILAARMGSRLVVRLGMLLEVVGMVMVAVVVSPTVSWWALVPGLLIYGAGVGFASAQLTNVLLQDIPVDKSGQASGAQSTTRQVGSALGVAVMGAILVTSLGAITSSNLQEVPGIPPAVVAQVSDVVATSAGQAIPALPEALAGTPAEPYTAQIVAAAGTAMADATQRTALAAAFFVLVGLLVTYRLPNDLHARRRDEEIAAERAAA